MFTKGKWEVNKTTTFEGREIYAIHTYPESARIQRVADVFLEANAQLIASAPDLYEALRGITAQFSLVSPLYGRDKEYIEQADKALSKADGNEEGSCYE